MPIVSALSAFMVGLVFGIGLIAAEMTNPAKVLGFLDLAGQWYPSLAFVILGAILVGLGWWIGLILALGGASGVFLGYAAVK